MTVQENIPLAPLTTLKVGGATRYLVEAASVAEVQEAIRFANSHRVKLFVLGGGSNVVISDAGWPGTVLKIAIPGIAQCARGNNLLFEVGAGVPWDNFVATAVEAACAGVECLSGIPGSVGGTPVQNVGAYGQEVSETIRSVSAIDLTDGKIREFSNVECGFNYRSSIFNTTARGRYIILKVNYELVPNGATRLEYADLKKHFAGWETTPTVSDIREAVRKIRASKGMLIVEGDDDCRSAGSFFKNPILTLDAFERFSRRATEKNLQAPSYPAEGSQKKVSAAWLVEHSGFSKGFISGNVGISRKHALAIINRGGATAADVVAFKNQIQDRVKEIWDVALQPEPVFAGW